MRVHGVLLLVLLASTAAPAGAPQGPLRAPEGPVVAKPFTFEARWAPSGEYHAEQLATWLDAVGLHEPGSSDQAARAAAAFTSEALSDLIAAFERQTVKTEERAERIVLVKRAIVLHTDIGLGAAGEARVDELNQSPTASLHLGVALELAGYLQSQQSRIKTKDFFVPTWWRAVAAILGEHQEPVSSIPFMRRAVELFRDDPEILLMAGAHHELLASPKELVSDESHAGEMLRTWRGTGKGNLKEAERLYRGVLRLDPRRVEARIRLGRVLELQGRYEEASGELTAAADTSAGPALEFYRTLFLGQAEEARGHFDAAREAYGRAITLYPLAQSARLALARLERTAGARAAELDAVLRLLAIPSADGEREDPWRMYFIPTPAQRSADYLEQLRAPFKRSQ